MIQFLFQDPELSITIESDDESLEKNDEVK